jgi:hypothetical protein
MTIIQLRPKMRSVVFSIIIMSLLSGCALHSSEKQNQQTLAAITESESRITNELETVKLGLSNQSDYIESLEEVVDQLNREVVALQSTTKPTIRIKNSVTSPQSAASNNHSRSQSDGPTSNASSRELYVLGAIENVQLENMDKTYQARVDTGSTTSSINALNVKEFEREGKKWVRFQLSASDTDKEDNGWVEAPIVRFANIRQTSQETVEKRAVIELWVKIGEIHEKSQFTLANRSQMSHPVLLGREFIQDIALVDVSKSFLLSEQNQNK